jgi:O-antigen/teichoic acid export membrane protein
MSDIINPSLKTAVKGTATVFVGMVISILLWFTTKILIIRNTTKEELGIYSLVVAIVGICSLAATLGLQEGIARYAPIYLGEGNREDAEAAARDSINLSIISSLSVFILLYFFSGLISRYIFYKPALEYPLKIMSFFIPFSVLANVRTGILRGFNVTQAKVYADIGQPLFFLLFLGLFFFFHLSFIGIMWAYVFAMALVFIFMSLYCVKKTALHPFSIKGGGKGRELLKFSLPLIVVALLGIVLSTADTLMLGRYVKVEDVGIYNVSTSLAKLMVFPLSAFGFVFMPLAGSMYSRNEIPELKRTYQVLTKWIFAATLPIFFILFFFPEMTITFLFSGGFIGAAPPLRILLVGFLLKIFVGVNGLLMMVMGMSKMLMKLSIFGTLFNILLNYIFIKHLGYGIAGAASASLLSTIIMSIMVLVILYRKSKIHPFTSSYIKPVIGTAFIGIVLYVIAKSLPLYFWMMPLYFIAFLGGYVVSLRVTKSLVAEDVMLLNAILEKMGVNTGLVQKIFGSSASKLNNGRS